MASSHSPLATPLSLSRPHVPHNYILTHPPFVPSPRSFPVRPRSLLRVRNAPHPLTIRCVREHKAAAVTKESWDKMILKSETPVLVEFYASWCGPCRMVHRVINEIATDYAGRLKCYVLNTDDDFQLAKDYEIKAVPVVVLFKNGKKCDSVVGTMPKDFYVAAIERALKQ